MTIIDRAELLTVTRSSAPHHLVCGSEPNGFIRAHIPGSVTFASPADAVRVLGCSQRIVVYGSEHDCGHTEALYDLLGARLPHVDWYRAGVNDRAAAG